MSENQDKVKQNDASWSGKVDGKEYKVFICGEDVLMWTEDAELYKKMMMFGSPISDEQAREIMENDEGNYV